jgi:S1-C subfamily serine protease
MSFFFKYMIGLGAGCGMVWTILLVASPASAADGATVFARYKSRAAHIETIGDLFNGTRRVGSGSGFLITARYVVTNNHVVPPAAWYKSLVINVRLGSRDSIPVPAYQIHRDVDRDLAIIELATPLPGGSCPVPIAIDPPESVAEGTELLGLGYPVDEDLSIAGPGLLSNKKAPLGRWTTSLLFNVGNSGEPVFTGRGRLVGFAVGGITSYQSDGGEVHNVTGINRFIPFSALASSSLYELLTSSPSAERCWGEASIAAAPATALPNAFQQSFNIDLTNDDAPPISRREGRTLFSRGTFVDISGKSELDLLLDWGAHRFDDYQIRYPKLFSHTVSAAPNYRFDDREKPKFVLASLNPTTTPLPNHACDSSSDVDCWEFSENRRSTTFRIRLYGGWEADRTRGWIHGEVLMRQVLER